MKWECNLKPCPHKTGVECLQAKIQHLAELKQDWDSYGAEPIADGAFRKVAMYLIPTPHKSLFVEDKDGNDVEFREKDIEFFCMKCDDD